MAGKGDLLKSHTLPKMSERMLDVLHIIWLLLEEQGLDSPQVNQAWHICQSIWRGGKNKCKNNRWPAEYMYGKKPCIPGLRLSASMRPHAPCILPRGHLWLNALLRFATGGESLQLQGVHLQTLCPGWASESDALLKQIAGGAYSLTVVGWYVLLALVAFVRASQLPATGCTDGSLAATAGPRDVPCEGLHPRALAQKLMATLLKSWPEVFQGCCTPKAIRVTLGSLCSGADFVKPFAIYLGVEISAAIHPASLTVEDKLACEKNNDVWGFRRRCVTGPLPTHFHPDLHDLPWDTLPVVDVMTISTECTSLSHQNFDRRSLIDVNLLKK